VTERGEDTLAVLASAVLPFARDLSVPFTNKQAECDVHPTKTQMKINGCHRSVDTARG